MTRLESEYLDLVMTAARQEADASGWSEDGKVLFVRNRMDAAYRRLDERMKALESAERNRVK